MLFNNLRIFLLLALLAVPLLASSKKKRIFRSEEDSESVESAEDVGSDELDECPAGYEYDDNYDNDNDDDDDDDDDEDYTPKRSKKSKRQRKAFRDINADVEKEGYDEEDEDKIPDKGGKCASGWTAFNRVRGKWCIKVFVGGMTFEKAQMSCSAEGAVLSSVETKKEKDFIHKKGVELFIPSGAIEQKYIWAGVRKSPQCIQGAHSSTYSCLPYEVNTFYWTDQHSTGKKQLDIGCFEGSSDCAALSIQTKPVGDKCTLPGAIIETWCTNGGGVVGYVCGKEAAK